MFFCFAVIESKNFQNLTDAVEADSSEEVASVVSTTSFKGLAMLAEDVLLLEVLDSMVVLVDSAQAFVILAHLELLLYVF